MLDQQTKDLSEQLEAEKKKFEERITELTEQNEKNTDLANVVKEQNSSFETDKLLLFFLV